jgi:hypothetical protein
MMADTTPREGSAVAALITIATAGEIVVETDTGETTGTGDDEANLDGKLFKY